MYLMAKKGYRFDREELTFMIRICTFCYIQFCQVQLEVMLFPGIICIAVRFSTQKLVFFRIFIPLNF